MKSFWRVMLVFGVCLSFLFPWTEYVVYATPYNFTSELKPETVIALNERRGNVDQYILRPAYVGEAIEGKRIWYGATLLQAAAIALACGTAMWVAWRKELDMGVDGGGEAG